MDLTPSNLGKYIPFIRKKANLSQEELADIANLSRTAIQGIEAGKESLQIDTLLKICHVLNIKLSFNHPLISSEQNK